MSAKKNHIPRRIAPRLASGEKRIPTGNGLPPIVKFALRTLADAENRSMSYIIEEILIDWARHHRSLKQYLRGGAVDYIPRKTPTAEEAAAAFKAEQRSRARDEADAAVAAVARSAKR